jgi:hypothetical protein
MGIELIHIDQIVKPRKSFPIANIKLMKTKKLENPNCRNPNLRKEAKEEEK